MQNTTRNVQKEHADDVSSNSSRFKWKIENISNLNEENLFSPIFKIGPHKWQLLAFRRGCNTNGYLSIYVVAIECKEWQFAKFSLSLVDQTNNRNTLKKDTKDMFRFTKDERDWGFGEFIKLEELKDPSNGYIVNDACIAEVEFCLDSIQDFKEEVVPIQLMEPVEERNLVTMPVQQCHAHRKLDEKLAYKESVAEIQERSFGIDTTASIGTSLDNTSAVTHAFCQTSTVPKDSGCILHIANGEQVVKTEVSGPNVVHVHRKGIDWNPNTAEPKNKRGNNLMLNDTPTPRHDIHCGVDYRGLHKNDKKKDFVQGSISRTCEAPPAEDNVFQYRENDLQIKGEEFELSVLSEGALMIRDGPHEESDDDKFVFQGKGKKTVVASPEATPQPQVKKKKPRKKPSPKGKHIPKGGDMLLPKKKNGRLWGEAPDGSAFLFSYPHSWAAKVCECRDHELAIKKMKHQKAKHWPLDEECKAVRDLVLDTGLGNGILNHQSEFDSIVVTSFRERYWPETDTFHLPFGEMTITPDDVKQILNLNVEGQAVSEGFDNNMGWRDLYALVKDTLGWEQKEAELEFQLAGGDKKDEARPKPVKKILLKNLRAKFGGTLAAEVDRKEVIDETRARRTATAYLLYSLGTIFFPDNSGNRVNVHYLQWLKNLQETKEYSWGTATLSYLLDSLRKASRAGATEVAGNVGLFQAWVYDHFPSMRPSTSWEDGDTRPTGRKFIFTGTQIKNKEEKIAALRLEMDAFTVEDVIFDPYLRIMKDPFGEHVDGRIFSSLKSYNGPLFHPLGFVMANPRRVLRQYGYVQQKVTEESFKLCVNGSTIKSAKSVFTYDPMPTIDVWNDRREEPYQVQMEELGPALGTKLATEDYLAWYYHFGHPRVINNDPEAAIHLQWAQENKKCETEKRSEFDVDWKALYFMTKRRCLQLAERLTPFIKKGKVLTSAQLRDLQKQIKDLPDPNKNESFEDLKRGLKRSRHSRDVGTSQSQLSPSSEDTSYESTKDNVQDRIRGHGGREGPSTGGYKRRRGRDHKE